MHTDNLCGFFLFQLKYERGKFLQAKTMTIELIDLSRLKQTEQYRSQAAKNGAGAVLTVRTNNGWRTIDSPFDPSREACQMVGTCLDNSAIVLGAGSGFVAKKLYKTAVSRVLLITGSINIAKENLQKLSGLDWGKKKYLIIAADCLDDCLIRHIKCFLKTSLSLKIITHPREINAYPALFNPLSVYMRKTLAGIFNKPAMPPKKILFPNAGQLLEPEIIAELKKRSLCVESCDPFSDRKITAEKAFNIIEKTMPDLVFSINNRGSDPDGLIPEVCSSLKIPWATWFVDEPRFIVSEKQVRKEQNRFGFCWDIAGCESCRNLGFLHMSLLPLSTDTSIFNPGKGLDILKDRVVYVGSPSFGNEARYFASICKSTEAQRIAEKLMPGIISGRRLPGRRDVQLAMDETGIKRGFFPNETFMRLPAYALYLANINYRVNAIKAVADLKPVVFGDGWDGLLPDNVEIHGYVDYYTELADIYRSDAVHISLTHLQMRHYPNQRIFDVGACQRIVVGDRVGGWHELFGSNLAELVFDSFDELHSKALFFIHNPDMRKQLGQSLYNLIIQRHTIGHRITAMLDYIRQKGQNGFRESKRVGGGYK